MKSLFFLLALAFAIQGSATPNAYNPFEALGVDQQMSEANSNALSSQYIPESEDALAYGGGCHNCSQECCRDCTAVNHRNECVGHWYEFCCVRSPH